MTSIDAAQAAYRLKVSRIYWVANELKKKASRAGDSDMRAKVDRWLAAEEEATAVHYDLVRLAESLKDESLPEPRRETNRALAEKLAKRLPELEDQLPALRLAIGLKEDGEA